jgi:basic amino acid/polyamine antiporter, APA family
VGASAPPAPSLVRAIGRWAFTAAVINSVIGSGIFGLPSTIAGHVGSLAPLVVLASGACVFVVVLCFAEVGSRFEEGGGPYLYASEAFGPAIGFHVGWLHIWSRLLSGAAVLNVFTNYLSALVPAVGTPFGRAAAMVVGMSIATAINVRGVRQASWTVNLFTVAKLLPLALLVLVGVWVVRPEVLEAQRVAEPNWTEAVLLLVFAYGGFESGVVAAGEVREPRRDTAFALVVAMGVVTVVYTLVQLVIVGVLPAAARSTAPVADALGRVLGGGGVMVGALAVVVSVYGWMAGFALMTPRILLAMAQRGEMPAVLARVHPDRRTPHPAIVANSVVALALALFATFAQMATLAAVVRLGIYAATCATLIALRRRAVAAPGFRLPAGDLLALVGIAFCGWLLATRSLTQAWALAGIVGSGALVRLAVRRRPV